MLVVDDGSTDGSASIIDEYVQKDSRIRVLTQENQGLSMARNNGVDIAYGEYVWFVDADDELSPRSVSLICSAIESQPDVIPIYAKTDGVDKIRNAVPIDVKTGRDVILSARWEQCGVFWVLRRAFLLEKNLRFMPGVYHEDAEFTPRMLYAASSVNVVPEVLYTVYRDPNSITQVPRAKRAFDYLTIAESLSRFVEENGEIGTRIGVFIDDNIAQDINNAFYVIRQNSKEEQFRLNKTFFSKRKRLLRALKMSSILKYRLEALLFGIFPKHYIEVYKFMKMVG